MMYYKVKQEYDQEKRFMWVGSQYNIKFAGILIGNELYTPAERNKIANSERFFEIVNIPKSKTYRFCGARFEDKN